MSVRVVAVGLGPLGRMIAADLIARGRGEIVGAVDVDPALVGRPVDELVDGAPEGVVVIDSLDGLDWDGFDAAIVATVSDLQACTPTLRTLLKHGKTVVSTCEHLVYPWLRHASLAEELDALARAHEGRVLGTGVNPGFVMDTLAIALSAVSRRVDRVRIWRVQDAADRRASFQAKICAGLDRTQASARVDEGLARHVGLGESIFLMAHFLGFELTGWNESVEFIWADRDMTCDLGPIPKGHARGLTQRAVGMVGDEAVIELVFTAAIGQEDPYDRIVLSGDPPMDVRIAGGIHGDSATVAIVVNALASLMVAGPGLHTPMTMPMIRVR